MGQGGRCLSESGVVDLLSGVLQSGARGELERHLESCDRCAHLIGEAANDTGRGPATPGDSLRPALLSPGNVIADRYHVRRLLGTGAMGEVHEVEDRLVGTTVALKTLNARLVGDARALGRLKREVAAARLVTHPNVCRIFDLGIDRDQPGLDALVFLTMEYLPGITLSRFLRDGSVSPAAALPLLIQLADGLGAAHSAGILHRDLKTENVMLVDHTEGGRRAVIMDFGLASFSLQDEASSERNERGSGFSGTIAYAAPERMAGGRATAASDVYALGLIAREMLTGRPPTIPALTGQPAALPAEIPPRLARRWQELLARATHLEAGARFANGAALTEALRALGRERPEHAGLARRVSFGLAAVAAALIPAAILRAGHPHPPPVALTAPVSPMAPASPPASAPPLAERAPAPEIRAAGPVAVAHPRRHRSAVARPAAPAPTPVATAPSPVPDDDLVRELHRRAPAEDDFALADPFHR